MVDVAGTVVLQTSRWSGDHRTVTGGGAGGGGAEPRPSDRITPVIGGRGLDGTGGTHGNSYWPCHDHVIGPRFRRSRLAYRHETTIDADGRRRRSLFDILPTALGRDQQQQQMTIDQEGSFPFFFFGGAGGGARGVASVCLCFFFVGRVCVGRGSITSRRVVYEALGRRRPHLIWRDPTPTLYLVFFVFFTEFCCLDHVWICLVVRLHVGSTVTEFYRVFHRIWRLF